MFIKLTILLTCFVFDIDACYDVFEFGLEMLVMLNAFEFLILRLFMDRLQVHVVSMIW